MKNRSLLYFMDRAAGKTSMITNKLFQYGDLNWYHNDDYLNALECYRAISTSFTIFYDLLPK